MQFKFGKAKASLVKCTSVTECTLVTPAHAAETVDVLATANKAKSATAPGDKFTFN